MAVAFAPPRATTLGAVAPYVDDVALAVTRKSAPKKTAAVPVTQEAADGIVESVAGKTLDAANTAVGITNMAMMPLMIGPVLVGLAGGAAGKVGQWTGWRGLQNAGGKIAGGVGKFNSVTFADLGNKLGINGAVSRAAQPVADRAGGAAQWVLGKTGIGGRMGYLHDGRAHSRLLEAQHLAKALDVSKAPEALRGDMSVMKSMFENAATVSHLDHHAFGEAMGRVNLALEEKALAKEAQAILRPFGRFQTAAGKAIGNVEKAAAYRNPSTVIKNLPKAIGGTSAAHGLMAGGWIAASGLSMFNDARGFRHDIKSLKQLYADTTGTKLSDVSTVRVLFGDAPAVVRDARKHMLKIFSFKEIMDAISIGVNVKFAKQTNNMGFIKSTLAFMAPDWLSRRADDMLGNKILPVYEAVTQAYQSGQPLPAEAYAALLTTASKELQSRDENDAFVQALAAQYAAAKTSPAEVMKEISNGKMMSRISRMIVEAENAAEQAHAAPARKQEKPVVGKHTHKLHQAIQQGLEPGRAV